jgi:hypothetical protein
MSKATSGYASCRDWETRVRASLWLLTALLSACAPGKAEDPLRDGSPEVGAPQVATAKPVLASNEAWSGKYASEAGSLYVVDGGEWAGLKWRGDDASTGLGEGVLALTLDGQTHRVAGTGSGVLGDIVLVGGVDGKTLMASVLRKDPLDRGLTGTAVGTIDGDRIDGTMRLSLADARVIRNAKFTLARSKP